VNTIVRLRGQSGILAALVALIMVVMTALPAGAAALQPSDQLKVGPVVTFALDNVGGGWGWTGPSGSGDSSHLIRLQDGSWRDVPRSDPAWGALKNAAAVDKIVLSDDGKSGWAIGTGGGPNIWQFKAGSWQQAALPFEKTVLLIDLTADAGATDGWITAQDPSAHYLVARLQNGRWARDVQPVNGEMRFISLAPGGKVGWGIGPNRNDPSAYIAVRLADGKWIADPAKNFGVPFNSIAVTADDNGNGWAIGPPTNSSLVRLTDKGATQVLPDPRQEKPLLYPQLIMQAIAVNRVGRGWATATYQPVPDPKLGHAPVNQPLLFRLDGDTYTLITPTISMVNPVPSNPVADKPNYAGPLAFTPDGAHSWLAEATGDSAFIGLSELREPWEHNSPRAAEPLKGAGVCFDEVKYCLRGDFATYWHERGGLYNMGYPITPEVEESIGGTTYVVQYTQRARMEYHPEYQGTPYVVELGLLGDVLSDPRANEPPFRPAPAHTNPGSGIVWFSQTQHNLGPPFYAYWNANGGLPIFGYPRSEAFQEVNQADNHTYLVQYFERNRIEYHPENSGTQFEFLLGLLGVEQFKATYGYTP
jgi:hypothetical protein